MDDVGALAFGAGRGDGLAMAASVAAEGVIVAMESEREETVRAEGLPATSFAERDRGGAAAIMEDQGLVVMGEVIFDALEKGVGKIAITSEILAIFEIDDGGADGSGGSFGLSSKSDERMFAFSKVIIGDEGGGGTEETSDAELAGGEAGEADGGVFGGVFLEIGGFVGLVDDDEAEIADWGEEGGARADDELGLICLEEVLPGTVTGGLGLARMEEGDAAGEVALEDLDELGGEGDFGDEEDDGAPGGESFGGESEVEIGFAAAGDAVEEFGGAGGGAEGGEGGALVGVQRYMVMGRGGVFW